MSTLVSFVSELYHFLAYSIRRPKIHLDKGIFIISIDVDAGSRELAIINRGKNDSSVSSRFSEYRVGEIDEVAFPLFVSMFDDFEIPVTFAIRGQLTEVNDSILELFPKSSVKHDIGAHGYYHREFTKLSHNEAENELNLISTGMKKFGIIPRSFIFPRNRVAHLELLEKHGYKCYKGPGRFLNDSMYIERQGRLFIIHPSLYLDQSISSVFPKKIVDIAIAKKLPFHVWFHLWNFGGTKESIQSSIKKTLFPLLNYGKKKEKTGELTFETMLSAAKKVEELGL